MRIQRHSLISGARDATGLAVIIDVFRAFTTAAYVMANGAEKIIPTGSLDEAFKLKTLHPEWVLMGERDGKRVPGFDYGNSPFELKDIDLTGKTIVQTTGAGTQGLVNATGAEVMLLGSFVMANAIVRYIRSIQPSVVSLVAMGSVGVEECDEDELCATYIQSVLQGQSLDFEDMKRQIAACESGAKFFDPSRPQFREEDFHMSLELDRFDFVLVCTREDQGLVVKKRTVRRNC